MEETIIPLQLFGYYVAVGKGCDVDKPRNLAKSAEMTDEEIDGFTGATPQTGKMTFTWNFTDNNGKKVNKGKFRVCVEATLKNE